MLHDEPSETAQQWLENVRREKRRQSLYSDIPYIDDVDIPDSALDVPESDIRFRDDGTDKKPPESKHEEDAEVDGLAGNFLVNFFVRGLRGRRGTVPGQEGELRSALYARRMARSSTEGCVMGRAGTVVEQAEAKGAFKRRNSIKKSMIRNIGKSIETLSHKESRRSSKDDDIQVQSSTNHTKIPTLSVSGSRKGSSEDKRPSISRPRPMIRSMSDVGLIKLATIKLQKRGAVNKKKMMAREWTRTYEDMCDRAQKLENAIKVAETEELEVKPVNTFKADKSDNCDAEAWKERRFNTGSFYSLTSIVSSDTDELEFEFETVERKKKSNAIMRKKFKDKISLSDSSID